MATTGPSPLPPTTILHTRPITQSDAHDFLSAYLDRSTSDPSLQPNAVLSDHGPISRNTAAAPSLTLHNLKRVQAGLGGEVLGKDLELEMFESEEKERGARRWFEEEIAAFGGKEAEREREEQEWRDRREFEAEQLVEEGKGEGDVGADDEVDGMPVTIDKEERKRKKKEKRKEEKRTKAIKG